MPMACKFFDGSPNVLYPEGGNDRGDSAKGESGKVLICP